MKHIFLLCLALSTTLAAWIDPTKTRASKSKFNAIELPQMQFLCNDIAKKLSLEYTTKVKELSQSFDIKLKTLQAIDPSEDSPEFKSLIQSYDVEIKKALDNQLANYSSLLRKCKSEGVILDENAIQDIIEDVRSTTTSNILEEAEDEDGTPQPQGDYDWDVFNHIKEQRSNVQEDSDQTFTNFVDVENLAGKTTPKPPSYWRQAFNGFKQVYSDTKEKINYINPLSVPGPPKKTTPDPERTQTNSIKSTTPETVNWVQENDCEDARENWVHERPQKIRPQLSITTIPTIEANLDYADAFAEAKEDNESKATAKMQFEDALKNSIYLRRLNQNRLSFATEPSRTNMDYADALEESNENKSIESKATTTKSNEKTTEEAATFEDALTNWVYIKRSDDNRFLSAIKPTEKMSTDLKTTTTKSWVQDSDDYNYDDTNLVEEQTTKTDSKKPQNSWMDPRTTTIKTWVQEGDNQYDDENFVDPIVEQTTKTTKPQFSWFQAPYKLYNNAKAKVVKVANDLKSKAKDLKSQVLNFGVVTTVKPLKPRGFYWTNYKKPDYNADGQERPIFYNPNELDDPLDYSQGNQPHRFTRSTDDVQMSQDLQQSVEPFGQISSQSSIDLMQHNYQSSASIGGLGHASIGLGQQDQQKADALREFQDFQLSYGQKTTQRPRFQTNLNIQMGSSRGLNQHSQDQLETDFGQQVVQQESSFDQQSSQDFLSSHGNKPTQRPRYQTGMNFQVGNSHGFGDQQSQNLDQNIDLGQQSETSFGTQQESSFDQQSSHQLLNHRHGHDHHGSLGQHHHSGDGSYRHHSGHSSSLGFGPSYDRYEPSQSHSIYTSESRTHTLGSNIGSGSQLNHNLDQSEDLQQQTQDFGSSYSHSDLSQQSQHNLGVNANQQFSLTKPLTHTLDKISDLQQQLGHYGQSTYNNFQVNSGLRQTTPSTLSQSTLDQSQQSVDFHVSSVSSNNRFKPTTYHSSQSEQNYQLFGGVTQSANHRGGLSQTKPTLAPYDSADLQVVLGANEGFQSQVSQQSEDFHLSSANRKPGYGSSTNLRGGLSQSKPTLAPYDAADLQVVLGANEGFQSHVSQQSEDLHLSSNNRNSGYGSRTLTQSTISPDHDTQQQTQDFQITGQSINQGSLELNSNQRSVNNRPRLDLQQNPEDFQLSQFSNSRQQTSQTFQQPEDYQISLQSGSQYRQSSQSNRNYQQSRPPGFDEQSHNSQQLVHDFQLAMGQTSGDNYYDSQRTSQAILQQSNTGREDLSQQSSQSILQQSNKAHSREVVEESSNSYLQQTDKKQVGGRLQTPLFNTNVNVTVEENHTGFWSGLGGKVKDNLNKAKDNVVKAKDTVKDTIGGFLG